MVITEESLINRIVYHENNLAQAMKNVDIISGALKEVEAMLDYFRKVEPLQGNDKKSEVPTQVL
jgi:hypothetical protein